MPTVTVRPGAPDEYVIPTTAAAEGNPSLEYIREFQTAPKLRLAVPRDEAKAANPQKFDTISVPGYPDHILKSVQKGGSIWTLVAYSVELRARQEPPVSGGAEFVGTDKDIITQLVGLVPAWTTGTINEFTADIAFTFDDAYVHEALRRVETNVPGELEVLDDGTVNYLTRIGSDKSGSVTLSPNAANVDGPLRILDDGQGDQLDATHVRVMGGHEGEARPRVNLVPSDDPDTYANEIRYSTPLWSSADDTEWGRWSNPDLTTQDSVEAEADALSDELVNPVIDVSTGDGNRQGVRGLNLSLGDTVTVDKPDADLQRPMRIHRIVDRVVGGVERQAAELSTRTYARDTDRERTRNQHRQTIGYQGASVIQQAGGFLQPVSSSVNATVPFRYPDVDYENVVQAQIKTLPYRSFVGADGHSHSVDVTHPSHSHDVTHPSHSHDVTHPSHSHDVTHPSHDHSVSATSTVTAEPEDMQTLRSPGASSLNITSTSGWDYAGGFTFSSDNNGNNLFYVLVDVDSINNDNGKLQMRVYNIDDNRDYPQNLNNTQEYPAVEGSHLSRNSIVPLHMLVPERGVDNDDTFEVQLRGTNDLDITVSTDAVLTQIGNHTHDMSDTSTTALGTTETSTSALGTTASSTSELGTTESSTTALGTTTTESSTNAVGFDPGVNVWDDIDQSPELTPSNVDLLVNGSTVASNIGSGRFETTVDLTDELIRDGWNDVEVTSDTRGFVSLTIYAEAYRKVGGGQ